MDNKKRICSTQEIYQRLRSGVLKFGTPELMPEFRKDLEDGLERPCIMRGTCAVLICPKI